MDISSIALKGITTMEATLGNPTFIWKGETFACVPNTLTDAIKNSDKWFNNQADFRMTVRLNQFTSNIYPQLNDSIYYMGYELKIAEIKKTPHNIFWVFICSLPTING